MPDDTVISVEGVSKKFCRSLKYTMLYGVRDVARDLFGFAGDSSGLREDEFWALNDVTFEVKRGECVGLIGPNGAGKSTLLKLLNGITLPDKGTIKVAGRIGALLELGAGFHPLLTGRENIRLNAAILGLTEGQINRKFDEIVDFAGLEEFIDSPVKHYSSGMYVRLGFAIAVHAELDIFVIDEALAVGDATFQVKCFAKLRQLKERGITVIFVTHNLNLVISHCTRALLLDRGMIVGGGKPKVVVDQYNRLAVQRSPRLAKAINNCQPASSNNAGEWRGLFDFNPDEDRYGTRAAEVLEAGIFTTDCQPVQTLQRNHEYLIRVKVQYLEDMPAGIVAYTIKDPVGTILCGTNTLFQKVDMGMMSQYAVVIITFRQRILLNPGEYLLCVGVAGNEGGEYVVYDRRFDYLPFQVVSSEPRVGLFDVDSVIEWIRAN